LWKVWCSHDDAAAAVLLWQVWVFLLLDLAPDRWHHVVASVVAVADEGHARFGDFDTWAFEVFFQAQVEFVKAAEFEIGHALLLVLCVAAIADSVCGWHVVGVEGVVFAEEFVAFFERGADVDALGFEGVERGTSFWWWSW